METTKQFKECVQLMFIMYNATPGGRRDVVFTQVPRSMYYRIEFVSEKLHLLILWTPSDYIHTLLQVCTGTLGGECIRRSR